MDREVENGMVAWSGSQKKDQQTTKMAVWERGIWKWGRYDCHFDEEVLSKQPG